MNSLFFSLAHTIFCSLHSSSPLSVACDSIAAFTMPLALSLPTDPPLYQPSKLPNPVLPVSSSLLHVVFFSPSRTQTAVSAANPSHRQYLNPKSLQKVS